MLASFLLALAAAATPLQDPVRVWATISSPTINVGEEAVLELNVETDGPPAEEIELPPIPPQLEVLGTSDFSQLQFTLPGGRSRLLRRQVVLRARAEGQVRIPPITVRVRGTTYRTRPVALRVVGSTPAAAPVPAPAAGVGGARGPGDEVVFRAWTEPDTVFVHQQATLQAEAMISEDAQLRLRRAPDYVPPDAAGFWIHDLPAQGRGQPQLIRGHVYQSQTFLRAYFPLAPGTYTLPPAKLIYEVRRGFLYTPDAEELTSDSLRIVVLPLPDSGRPPSFTGAVGRFAIRARLEPAEVPAGEATALIVEIEGEGNIESVPPPSLPEMPGVEAYPPSEDARISDSGGVIAGVKRFTWILVPGEAGRLALPAIEYGYFDPARRAYLIARSDSLVLDVRSGPGAQRRKAPDAVRPIRIRPAGPGRLGWVRSPGFVLLQFLPVAAGLWLAVRGRRRRSRLPSQRELRRRRDEMITALRARPPDDGAFLDDLAAAIRGWIADRVGSPELRRAAGAALADALAVHGVSGAAARAIADLLGRIDRARFEPEAPGGLSRRRLLDEAERLLSVADRQARRPAPPPTAAASGMVLLLIALGSFRFAGAQDDAFRTGVERFQAGDAAAAAAAFGAFSLEHPDDPNGWYNLGIAAHQAGDRGRAVWAWLRALRLEPRDADIRHNLALVDTDPGLVRAAAPWVPLRTEEFFLAASLAWILGTLALARSIARRSRRGAVGGGTAILLAVGLLAGWAAPRLGSQTGIVLAEHLDLRAAPTARAERLDAVPAGAGVRLLERRGLWLRVAVWEGGEEGWVESDAIGEF